MKNPVFPTSIIFQIRIGRSMYTRLRASAPLFANAMQRAGIRSRVSHITLHQFLHWYRTWVSTHRFAHVPNIILLILLIIGTLRLSYTPKIVTKFSKFKNSLDVGGTAEDLNLDLQL